MPNFGNVVAQPAQAVQVPQLDVSSGTQAVASTLAGINNDAAHRQLVLDEKQRTAQAALKLAQTSNSIQDAHQQVAQGVMDGSIPVDKAESTLSDQVNKIKGDALGYFNPEQQPEMDAHLSGLAGTAQRSLGEVVFKKKQQETASTIDQFGEQVSREAMRSGPQWASDKFGAMVDFTGQAAGLNEEQQAKLKQSFKGRVHNQYFEGQAVNALTAMDIPALQKLQETLNGPDGEVLDPGKRVVLQHQIFGYQQHILAMQRRDQNEADQEQARREALATDTYNKALDISMAGGSLSPDFINQLATAGRGTSVMPNITYLLSGQAQIAGFATKTAEQRGALIDGWKAARANPNVGTDPLSNAMINRAIEMDSKMRAAFTDNPWQAAQTASVIQHAAAMNPADPSSAAQVIAQRMQDIRKVEQWGGSKVSPLQPQEVETVAKMVRALPMDQAASMLANIGNTVGDAERVAAIGKQMHDKDGTLGLAMMYANAKTTEGRYTAELVLRGEQALRDKTVQIDSAAETGWRGQIAKTIRGAYSNREAEDAYVDAAYKITAAQYAKTGRPDVQNAINLATGGIAERNGQRVPIPYGMKEDEFDKRINAVGVPDIAPQAPDGKVYAGRTPVPVADFVASLPKATLVHAGHGLYNVRAGTSLITNSAGQRITIKVSP